MAVARRILTRQFGIAQNGGHDVVEVMGNATGQGADGLHLLRFTQLAFQRQLHRLGVGALQRQTGQIRAALDSGQLFLIWLHRFPVVDGKCAQHTPGTGDDRR